MKKIASLSFLIFLSVFTLYSQTYRPAKIYVPPVDGVGSMEENVFFYNRLTGEVAHQFRELVRVQRGSDFILRSSIMTIDDFINLEDESLVVQEMPEDHVPPRASPPLENRSGTFEFFSREADGSIYFSGTIFDEILESQTQSNELEDTEMELYEGEYVFLLEMIDSTTEKVIAKQHIIYMTIDETISELLSIVVYNILSAFPDIEDEDDVRNRWVFLSASALWVPRLYTTGSSESINWVNLGVNFAVELYFLDFMSAELGVQFMQDWVVVNKLRRDEHRDLILEIPLALKFVIKPSQNYMFEPYGGFSFNLSLMNRTNPSIVSWIAGLQFAFKAGPGLVTIDPRFTADIKNSFVENPNDGKITEYQRYTLQIGIGYKFGLVPKRAKPPLY